MAHRREQLAAKLFRLVANGDAEKMGSWLEEWAGNPDLCKDVRNARGLTVFHECLEQACRPETTEPMALALRTIAESLKRAGFRYDLPAESNAPSIEWSRSSWGRKTMHSVPLAGRTVLQCAQQIYETGAMQALPPATGRTVQYFCTYAQAQGRARNDPEAQGPQAMDVVGVEDSESGNKAEERPQDMLFRMIHAVRSAHDAKDLAAFLRRRAASIVKDVLVGGVTVFHACLLATRGTVDESSARAIVDVMKTLRDHGFVGDRRSGHGVEAERWGRYGVVVKDTTVAQCASAFQHLGKSAMRQYGAALAPVVKFVLDHEQARGRDLEAEADQQRRRQQATATPAARRNGRARAQEQTQLARQSDEELAVQTQLFAQVLESTFRALDSFVVVAGNLPPRAKRSMTNGAAQAVNLVGAHAAKLKQEGNTLALRVGRARVDEYESRYERDDRAWKLLEPFLAFLEKATDGKRTREVAVMGDLSWTEQGVTGAMSAIQGASHGVSSAVADARARSAELSREFRREASRPLRPNRRRVNPGRDSDAAMFSTTGVYRAEDVRHADDPETAERDARVWGA